MHNMLSATERVTPKEANLNSHLSRSSCWRAVTRGTRLLICTGSAELMGSQYHLITMSSEIRFTRTLVDGAWV